MGAEIRLTGGGRPDSIEINVTDAVPTEGDLLYVAQLKRARILRLAEQGRDYQGQPFAPYNRTRPYYFYPNGPAGKSRNADELKRDKAAVKRFASKIGRSTQRTFLGNKKTGRRIAGGGITPSGLGIKFRSYDDFKRTYLGRSNVDLRGPRAPHMLQQIAIKAGSQTSGPGDRDRRVGLNELPNRADTITIGIYGEAAERAAGHNSDQRPRGMPLRRFLASSDDDEARIARGLESRWLQRQVKKYGG